MDMDPPAQILLVLSNRRKFVINTIILEASLNKKMLPTFAVYIISCSNGSYYVGFSKNLHQRLKAHMDGLVSFTRHKKPLRLVHISVFSDLKKAYDFERYLKIGSGKAFMKKRLV